MGACGVTASAQAAGVVLLVDRLDRLIEALDIARHAVGIARQGVWVGMTLSLLAMLVAAAGYLPAVTGAVLQEGIDLLIIVNALRALGPLTGAATTACRPRICRACRTNTGNLTACWPSWARWRGIFPGGPSTRRERT